MMQENNNFETIISTWRRMSAEQGESVTVSMSGDSPDYQLHKKKDEEANLLVPEKVKGPIATAASAGTVAIISEAPSTVAVPELEENLLGHEKEDSKEAAGDGHDSKEIKDNKESKENKEKDDTDYLEDKDVANKSLESKHKSSDKVDSVFLSPSSGLKPAPPQSTTSNPDEDDCIIKCLYYTLQCCDCVLM